MNRRAVIAWGNAGRRDDGAALVLLERLGAAAGFERLDVDLHAHHQLGPEVAADVSAYDLVIFVDAHVDPDAADVYFEPVRGGDVAALDSHHCSPAALLALCGAFGWSTPVCWQVGIRANDCTFGDTLTAQTSRLVDRATRLILETLGRGHLAPVPSSSK